MAGAARGERRRQISRLSCGLALTAFAALVSAPAALANAPSLTWTGNDGLSWWSRPGNWNGAAPVSSESLGTLTFGELGAGCDSGSSNSSCYLADNNLTGLTVDALRIDDGLPYVIAGRSLTLGAGGITATPGSRASGQGPDIEPNLALSAAQTWNIRGGGAGQSLLVNNISGSSSALTLSLSSGADLYIGGSADVGPVNISGSGRVWLLSRSTAADLNGSDGNSVTVGSGTALVAASAGTTVGALTSDGGLVQVGLGAAPDGTLAVTGPIALNSATHLDLNIDQAAGAPVASTDYTQMTGTATVDLGGASLHLFQGIDAAGGCQDLKPSQVYTLVSTAGSINGTFAGIPDGSVVRLTNNCDSSNQSPTARINYNATPGTVTATIVSGGDAGDIPIATARPKLSGRLRQGFTLTAGTGSWTHSPNTYRYQWYRCSTSRCSSILGAVHRSYRLTGSDVGDGVAVDIEAVNGAGFTDAYSLTTKPISASTSAIRSALRRALSIAVKDRTVAAVRRAGGYTTTFQAPSGGLFEIAWYAATSVHKRILVAKGSATSRARGRTRVRIRLTAAGRRLLRTRPSVNLAAVDGFAPGDGRRIRVTRRVAL